MVALLFDPSTTVLLDALRVEAGETRLERIPPHVTSVAPFDVTDAGTGAAAAAVAEVAAGVPPLPLVLGPAATFAPRTPTVHLAVEGADGEATIALHRLPAALHAAGLGRPERRPYVPHVTLRNRVRADRLAGAVARLRGFEHRCEVGTMALLRRSPDAGATWSVVAESTLGHG